MSSAAAAPAVLPLSMCAALVMVAATVAAPAATAQGDVDAPNGYRFCGWKDFLNGGWTFEDPQDGAYLKLFSRKMSCRTALRKHRRVRYGTEPPYKPRLKGYRCVRLDQAYEYADVRCSRRGHPNVALRWQTGA